MCFKIGPSMLTTSKLTLWILTVVLLSGWCWWKKEWQKYQDDSIQKPPLRKQPGFLVSYSETPCFIHLHRGFLWFFILELVGTSGACVLEAPVDGKLRLSYESFYGNKRRFWESWQMAPNLTIAQMHLQCIRDVEIWEFLCDGCKSIRKFKICNHICTQYKSEAQT